MKFGKLSTTNAAGADRDREILGADLSDIQAKRQTSAGPSPAFKAPIGAGQADLRKKSITFRSAFAQLIAALGSGNAHGRRRGF
jgi:hypothetical protein